MIDGRALETRSGGPITGMSGADLVAVGRESDNRAKREVADNGVERAV